MSSANAETGIERYIHTYIYRERDRWREKERACKMSSANAETIRKQPLVNHSLIHGETPP